jgi:HEAT repeat protein
MGIFIDSDGNDTYMTTETGLGQGGGREARGFPSLGVFLDLGGKDSYAKGNPGEDETSWVQSKYGAGRDLKADTTDDGQEDEKEEETEEKLEGKSTEELFKVACLWEVGAAKKTARKARNLLVQRGDKALDHIFAEHMDTKSGLVVRAIRDISDSLQAKASPRLIKCLRDTNRRVAGNAVWVLGQIEDSSAVDSLIAVLDHPGIKARLVLRALGEIGDKRVTPDVVPYLQVDKETDRIYACYALQKLKDPRGINPLIDALADPLFTVRNGAEKALTDIGDTSLVPLLNSLKRAKEVAKPHIIRAIGVLAHKRSDSLSGDIEEVVTELLKYLDHKNPTIRGFTVEALERLGGEEIEKALEQHVKDEKDEFVLSRYRRKQHTNLPADSQ